jgi:hypothetical protein
MCQVAAMTVSKFEGGEVRDSRFWVRAKVLGVRCRRRICSIGKFVEKGRGLGGDESIIGLLRFKIDESERGAYDG